MLLVVALARGAVDSGLASSTATECSQSVRWLIIKGFKVCSTPPPLDRPLRLISSSAVRTHVRFRPEWWCVPDYEDQKEWWNSHSSATVQQPESVQVAHSQLCTARRCLDDHHDVSAHLGVPTAGLPFPYCCIVKYEMREGARKCIIPRADAKSTRDSTLTHSCGSRPPRLFCTFGQSPADPSLNTTRLNDVLHVWAHWETAGVANPLRGTNKRAIC